MIMRNLGFFSTAESLVANNITLADLPARHQRRVPAVPAAPSL